MVRLIINRQCANFKVRLSYDMTWRGGRFFAHLTAERGEHTTKGPCVACKLLVAFKLLLGSERPLRGGAVNRVRP
jgi:hypothetical protein